MHRHVTRRAIAIARALQVVKRGRLGAQGPAGEGGVALEAELLDPAALEPLRVVRAMGLVTAQAAADDAGDVGEYERSSGLGVAGLAGAGTEPVHDQAALAAAAVGIVAGEALETAAAETMGVRALEGGLLTGVAVDAQPARIGSQQDALDRVLGRAVGMHVVAGGAVDLVAGVGRGGEARAVQVLRVTAHAELVLRLAPGHGDELRIALLHVLRAVPVARFAVIAGDAGERWEGLTAVRRPLEVGGDVIVTVGTGGRSRPGHLVLSVARRGYEGDDEHRRQ